MEVNDFVSSNNFDDQSSLNLCQEKDSYVGKPNLHILKNIKKEKIMININKINWKSIPFLNACSSVIKHDYFNKPLYKENYREIFFEFIKSQKEDENLKANSILVECSEPRQNFSEETKKYFDEFSEEWFVKISQENKPIKLAVPIITSDSIPSLVS